MPRLLLFAVPLVVLATATGARGRGVVSVAITTLPVVVGQQETITVTVTAPCTGVHVDFGDGQSQNYPVTPPTRIVYYEWTSSGTKTVTATGIVPDCTGQASTIIDVQTNGGTSLGELCKAVDCGSLGKALVQPKITGVLAASKPAGAGYIKGKSFGSSQGSAVANLKRFDGPAQPETLQIVQWTPTFIEIAWPEDISGVRDQDATLHVVTADQKKSNEWPIQFRAAEVSSVFPQNEISHTDCGIDSNEDQCGWTYDADDYDGFYGVNPWPWTCSGTICGTHYNLCAAIGDDADKDVWVLPNLKNDWVYSGIEKLMWNTSGGSLSGPTGVQSNAPDGPVLTVTWKVTPCDDVKYDVAVRIRGPVGVPHK